jgi:hypothetical protein
MKRSFNFGNMFQRQERGCQLLLMVKFFVWPGKQYEYILRRGCQLLPMMYPGIKGELRLSSSARILTFTKQGWISPGCSSCRSGDIPVGGVASRKVCITGVRHPGDIQFQKERKKVSSFAKGLFCFAGCRLPEHGNAELPGRRKTDVTHLLKKNSFL